MAAKKLTRTVLVQTPPGSGQSFEVLEPGDEVPDWASDQVGDHCFEPVEEVSAAPIAVTVTEEQAAADGGEETPAPAKKSAAKKS